MNRYLAVIAALLAVTAAASAQPNIPPAPVPGVHFHPVGTTGRLQTTKSRNYWVSMERTFRTVESVTGSLTRNLGVPVVRLGQMMTTGSPTPDKPMTTVVWLAGPLMGADRKRDGGY